MSTELCPVCNRSTIAGICPHCENQRQALVDNSARAADANERAALAAEVMASAQQQLLQAQREEQERRQRAEQLAAFAALPKIIEQDLPAAQTSASKALLLLAKIEKVTRDLQPANWVELHQTAPVETEVIYAQLRKSVAPLVRALWQAKDRIPASSEPLLRTLARSLSCKDFVGLREFHAVQAQLDGQYAAQKAALTSEQLNIQHAREHQLAFVSQLEAERALAGPRSIICWIASACFLVAALVSIPIAATIDETLFAVTFILFMTPFLLGPMGLYYRSRARQLDVQLVQARADLANIEQQGPVCLEQIDQQLRQLDKAHVTRLQQLAKDKFDPTLQELAQIGQHE